MSNSAYNPSGLLQNTLVFNVKDYGALGDNSTNDTTSIQAAFDAAETSGGGVVFFPEGVYVSDPLYAGEKVSVLGAGQTASVIKRRPTTTSNTDSIGNLNFHGTSGNELIGFFVKDIGIDGNKSNITIGTADPYDVEGISLKFCWQFTIDNVRVTNAYSDGIDLDDCLDGLVTNSTALDCGGSGIHVSENSVGNRIVGNYVSGCGAALSRSGIDQFSSASSSVFVGNFSENNFRGFDIAGSGAVFSGNRSTGNTNSNILTGVGLSWTPTFSGLSGGTLDYAVYSVGDGWVDLAFQYTLSGANVSGGELTFTIPTTLSSSYAVPHVVGQAVLSDTGTASFSGIVMVDNTSGIFRIRAQGSAGTYVNTASITSTIPFTWGNTDRIFVTARYRLA